MLDEFWHWIRWASEILEKIYSKQEECLYQALVLFHEIKKEEKNALIKVLSHNINSNNAKVLLNLANDVHEPLGQVQLIKFIKEVMKGDIDQDTEAVIFVKRFF